MTAAYAGELAAVLRYGNRADGHRAVVAAEAGIG